MRPRLSTALPLRRLSQRLIESCDAESSPPAALVFSAVRRLASSRPRLLECLRWGKRHGPLLREQFWRGLDLNRFTDDLIDAGEIGLSQASLAAGVTLKARHSLMEMLMNGSTTSVEL